MKIQTPNSRINQLYAWPLITIILILISGCYAGYQQHSGSVSGVKSYIGRIQFNWGSNAFLNGIRARQGDPVYDKDRLTTGGDTSVSVLFPEGGFIQLDANTDPDFSKWFEAARCIIKAFIQVGQVYVETNNVCALLVEDTHLEAFAHTRFNLEVRRDSSLLSVVEGEMQIMRPTLRSVKSRQRLEVFNSGRTEVAPIPEQAINEIIRWRTPYNLEPKAGWCCANNRVFNSQASDCERRRGFFNHDRRETESACRSGPLKQGYCCSNGVVSISTAPVCNRQNGLFFTDQRNAVSRCGRKPQPMPGWCCSAGRVFQAMENDCISRRGVFNNDAKAAQTYCDSLIRDSGYCCAQGSVYSEDRTACLQSGGRFFDNKRMAYRDCAPQTVKPIKPDWEAPKIKVPPVRRLPSIRPITPQTPIIK